MVVSLASSRGEGRTETPRVFWGDVARRRSRKSPSDSRLHADASVDLEAISGRPGPASPTPTPHVTPRPTPRPTGDRHAVMFRFDERACGDSCHRPQPGLTCWLRRSETDPAAAEAASTGARRQILGGHESTFQFSGVVSATVRDRQCRTRCRSRVHGLPRQAAKGSQSAPGNPPQRFLDPSRGNVTAGNEFDVAS